MITYVDYEPRGAARELFYAREAEVLLEGPAGTGKTRAVCEYINWCCETFPGIRVLMARQTRKSLTESVLVTFEEKVLGYGHEAIVGSAGRAHRTHYEYPNGSYIAIEGLEHPERTFSTEYDLICVFEAVETSLDSWEKLARANRNNMMPWQQRIADCNPGSEAHWLNRRAEKGLMRRLLSRHVDNPTLTPEYLKKLSMLTGARLKRLYEGLWVGEEGQVWPEFDRLTHVIPADSVPEIKYHIASIDFGYNNPGCFQVWGVDADHRLYLLAEIYRVEWMLDRWAAEIVALRKEFPFRVIVCDSAEPRSIQFLNDYLGVPRGRDEARIAIPVDKRRTQGEPLYGLNHVRLMLSLDDTGKPSIFFVEGALRCGVDPVLEETSKPWSTTMEIPSYVFLKSEDGKPDKEHPDPACADHGCDALRYASVWHWRKDLTPREKPAPFKPGTIGHVLKHTEKLRRQNDMRNR